MKKVNNFLISVTRPFIWASLLLMLVLNCKTNDSGPEPALGFSPNLPSSLDTLAFKVFSDERFKLILPVATKQLQNELEITEEQKIQRAELYKYYSKLKLSDQKDLNKLFQFSGYQDVTDFVDNIKIYKELLIKHKVVELSKNDQILFAKSLNKLVFLKAVRENEKIKILAESKIPKTKNPKSNSLRTSYYDPAMWQCVFDFISCQQGYTIGQYSSIYYERVNLGSNSMYRDKYVTYGTWHNTGNQTIGTFSVEINVYGPNPSYLQVTIGSSASTYTSSDPCVSWYNSCNSYYN